MAQVIVPEHIAKQRQAEQAQKLPKNPTTAFAKGPTIVQTEPEKFQQIDAASDGLTKFEYAAIEFGKGFLTAGYNPSQAVEEGLIMSAEFWNTINTKLLGATLPEIGARLAAISKGEDREPIDDAEDTP